MDLKTIGIAIHEVVLHHLHFTPLKSLFKQGISLCVSYPSFCFAYCNAVLHINLKNYILIDSAEYSKLFRFAAYHTVSQNISFIVSGFPLSEFTTKLL